MKKGFYYHIHEAIQVNLQRKPMYAAMSNEKTNRLSNCMIGFQYFLMPIAKYFDWRASKFQKMQVPILENDFISMKKINAIEHPVLRQNLAPSTTFDLLLKRIKKYKKKAKKSSLLEICNLTDEELSFLEEQEYAHFPMLQHIFESIGFISLNALEYSKKTGGMSEKLSHQLIRLHLLFLKYALRFDKKAQRFFIKNIGIILNDIPTIPFQTLFHKVRA